jgi:hypothetical protein
VTMDKEGTAVNEGPEGTSVTRDCDDEGACVVLRFIASKEPRKE